jgi:oxygen-independent coproporphyrinogen-3 oxidase
MDSIKANYQVMENAEITAESNPATSDGERFDALRKAGFNRLSIGVQSFDDRILKIAERRHSASEAQDVFQLARKCGFDNINIDLMFGLPSQSLSDWRNTLDRAIQLKPDHIACYALMIEDNTPFEKQKQEGNLDVPEEDIELAMYELTIERLLNSGYNHYEVSNFAKPGKESKHNLTYWNNDEYLGFGPGAVSYLNGRRWKNETRPSHYIRKTLSGDTLDIESEQVSSAVSLAETIMLGLRLRQGVSMTTLQQRYGKNWMNPLKDKIRHLESQGYLILDNNYIKLTHKGLLFASDVSMEFLP